MCVCLIRLVVVNLSRMHVVEELFIVLKVTIIHILVFLARQISCFSRVLIGPIIQLFCIFVGSASPSVVSAGYYGVGPAEDQQYNQTKCPPGSYCSAGIQLFPGM